MMTLPRYEIRMTPVAEDDMDRLHYHIAFECFQQDTADRYLEGVQATIAKLAWLGGIIGVSLNKNLRREYGTSVRIITYKKMSIIYNLVGDCVIVRRVIAGRNIK
jgi:plasmid stabilization system protein ParE